MSKRRPPRLLSVRVALLVALLGLGLMALRPTLLRAMPLTASDAVQGAWLSANDLGRYEYATRLTQTIHPTTHLENAGRGSKTTHLTVEGALDRRAGALHFAMQGEATEGRALEVRMQEGRAEGRMAGSEAWQPLDSVPDLTGGDPLGFLVAATAVQEAELTASELEGGLLAPAAAYRYDLDGPRYARYIREQMAASLRQSGALPPGVSLELVQAYVGMEGSGEIWLNEAGLPVRQRLHLTFPAERGGLEWVEAEIVTDFSGWDASQAEVAWNQALRDPRGLVASAFEDARVREAGGRLGLLLLTTAGVILLIIYRHSRALYAAVALTAILSMVAGPLMQVQQIHAFSAELDTPAATQPAEEALPAPFDPRRDPLAELRASVAAAGAERATPRPRLLGDDYPSGEDSDGDGLDNEVELLKLGTDPGAADTDGDDLDDWAEVIGFTTNSRAFHLDPNDPDTNDDGRMDGFECPDLAGSRTQGNELCADTDGDETPDVFDFDDDGDGVPDGSDTSPAYVGTMTTSVQEQFSLALEGYETSESLYVAFEVRPENPQHLWYVNSVLDWPTGDEDGQIQRKKETTFADEGQTGTRMDDGDVLLTPMLEITLTFDASNPTGGLPVAAGANPSAATFADLSWVDSETLDSYGISFNEGASDSEALVYVPLSTVVDPVGDLPVALTGRMMYRPEFATWGQTQEVRLLWLITALTDTCDTSAMPSSSSPSGWCASDANWVTTSSVIQSYYDPFVVTGIGVREEVGMDVLLAGQANATTASYENYLWHLGNSLQGPFLSGQRLSAGGARFDLDEIYDRFYGSAASHSDTERWDIPATALTMERFSDGNGLRYENQTEGLTALVNTEIPAFLSERYGTPSVGTAVTLLLAREERYRWTSLEEATVANGTATFSLESLEEQVVATLSWSPYVVEEDGATGSWASFDVIGDSETAGYLDLLDTRLTSVFDEANLTTLMAGMGETLDSALLTETQAGAVSMALNFYLALAQSIALVVEVDGVMVGHDDVVADSDYQLEGEVVTGIVEGMISEMTSYFLWISSISVDGAEVASSLTAETSASDLLVTTGISYLGLEVNVYSQVAAGVAQYATFRKMLRHYGYVRKAKIRRYSTGGRIVNFAYIGGSIGAAALTISYQASGEKYEGLMYAARSMSVAVEAANVIQSVDALRQSYRAGKLAQGLHANLGLAKKSSLIAGLVADTVLAVGMLAYTMIANDIGFGDLEFTRLLALTIASIIVAVLLTIISILPGGTLLVALLGLIDALFMLLCDVGVVTGATTRSWLCTSGVTGALTRAISYVIFDQTPIMDVQRSDRMDLALHEATITQNGDNDGYVLGNTLNLTATITATLYLNSPTSLGYTYWHQFNDGNLDDTRMGYELSQDENTFSLAGRDWKDHPDQTSTRRLYDTFYPQESVLLTETGLNVGMPLSLNESLESDVQECWLIYVPPFLAVPVCYIRDGDFTLKTPTDLSSTFVFDVLPPNLDGFLEMAGTGNDSFRLAWDGRFPTLADADGDGLRSQAVGGPDEDDAAYDSDNDGLSDFWESYNGFDSSTLDGDGDGLYDYWEAFYGSDPTLPDGDGDGLLDGEEAWHSAAYSPFDTDSTRQGSWSGGWLFAYAYDGSTPLTTRVNGDPALADPDDDGYSDKVESNYNYHPAVLSELQVMTLEAGVTAPGALANTLSLQPGYNTLEYTATVKNELALDYLDGLLEVEIPQDSVRDEVVMAPIAPAPLGEATTQGSYSATAGEVGTESTMLTMTLRAGAVARSADTGRVLWLHLNETTTPFPDDSGRSNPATCSAPACPTTNGSSVGGSSLNFDGSDDRLTVAQDTDDFTLDAFTLSAWVRPDTQRSLSHLVQSTGFTLGTDSTGKPHFTIKPESCASTVGINTSALTSGVWHHLGASYDGVTLKLYLDGNLVASNSTARLSTCPTSQTVPNTSALSIGYNFDGSMDEIEIFDTALTGEAMEDLYKRPVVYLTTLGGEVDPGTTYEDSSPFATVLVDCPSGVVSSFDPMTCASEVSTPLGSGFSFSGSSFATLSLRGAQDSDLTANNDTFSYALWLYPENDPASSTDLDDLLPTTREQMIIGNDKAYSISDPLSNYAGYEYAAPSVYLKGKKVVVRFGIEGNTHYCEAITTNDVVDYNSWQHLTVVYNDSYFTLYKNGSAVATGSAGWTYNTAYCGSGYDTFTHSGFESFLPIWFLYVGNSFRTNLYFVSLTNLSNTSEGDSYDEGYIWDDTRNVEVWTGGPTSSATTLAIGATMPAPNAATDIQYYSFCDRDDDSRGSDCDGGNDQELASASHTFYKAGYQQKSFSGDWSGTLTYWAYGTGFVGKMDEINVYRNDLDAEDVAGLYSGSLRALDAAFDEAPGQDLLTDDSGNDYSLYCASAATCPDTGLAGNDNQSVRFDGSDDILLTTDTTTTFAKADFTLATWVKTTATSQAIVTKSDGDGSWESGEKSFYLDSSGKPTFVGWGNEFIRGSFAVNDGTWHHVAVVWDYSGSGTSGTGKIYVDGVDRTASSTYAANKSDNTGDLLRVGASNRNASEAPNFFSGSLDRLVVLREARSAAQIVTLMQEAPLFNLHLDESLGSGSFADVGLYETHLTCSGEACPAAGTKGKMREAALFDGNDKLINTAAGSLDVTNFTVGLWVKPSATRYSNLLRKHNGSGGNWNFGLWTLSDGIVKAEFTPGTCNSNEPIWLQSRTALPEDQWTHVLATYDGNTLTLYLNGAYHTHRSYTTTACTTNNDVLELGEFFVGALDEALLYSYALDADEVERLYDYQQLWYDTALDFAITLDTDKPTIKLKVRSTHIRAGSSETIAIAAADASGVALVEYSYDGSIWLPLDDADGGDQVWVLEVTPTGTSQSVYARATDSVGNVSSTASHTFSMDGTAPDFYMNPDESDGPRMGTETLTISGVVADSGGSGVPTNTTTIDILDHNGLSVSDRAFATVSGETWQIAYPMGLAVPHGEFTVEGSTSDAVGNTITQTLGTLALDSFGPHADLTTSAKAFTATGSTLGGTVSDALFPSESLLHFHFEEGTGTTAFPDSSANHIPASCTSPSCPTAAYDGQIGDALFFDGTNDYLATASGAITLTDSSFTLAAWTRRQSSGTDDFFFFQGTNATNQGLHMGYRSTNTFTCAFFGNDLNTTSTYTDSGAWHHWACTYDANSGTRTLYRDGVQVAQDTPSVGYQGSGPLLIGRGYNAARSFHGRIDEVQIYPRALGADDLYRMLYGAETTVATVQLRFRHAREGDPGESGGIWHSATVADSTQRHSSWSYTLTEAMEGPYKIDLKATDNLGNTRYLADMWAGVIDTRAPRVTLTYTQLTPTTAQVACAADDFFITDANWLCPVSTLSYEYEEDDWYTAIFSPTEQLVGLASPLQTLTLTSATMQACDLWGHCTSRASTTAAAPGGIATDLTLWLRADAGTGTTTDNAAMASWTDQSSAGNTLTQATTAHQPTYQAGELNGNPVVHFDSSDYLARTVTASSVFNATTSTIYFVKQSTSGLVWFKWQTANSNRVGFELASSKTRFDFPNDSTGRLVGAGVVTNDYHLITGIKSGSTQTLYLDGAQDATRTGSSSLTTSGSAALTLGKNAGGALSWEGDIAEVVIYRSALSTSARAQVDSYLALKYGLTLAAAQPYLDSTGDVLWNGTGSSYHHDVAGLGRDDVTGLAQRQARSASDDAIVTMTVGNSPTAPATPDEDRTFLLWGNDDGARSAISETSETGSAYSRLARVWQVQETGDLGATSIRFNLTGLGLMVDPSEVALLIDNDGDFTDASAHTTGRSVSGSIVTFTGVDFVTGDTFTLLLDGTVELVPDAGEPKPAPVKSHAPTEAELTRVPVLAASPTLTTTLPISETLAPDGDRGIEATSALTPTITLTTTGTLTPTLTLTPTATMTPTLEAAPTLTATIEATATPEGTPAPLRLPPGDSTPPSGLTLTLLANGQPLPTNRTIESVLNPLLTVQWQPASDPSGIAGYEVLWLRYQGGVASPVASASLPPSATSHSFQASETQHLAVQVSAIDGAGNRQTEEEGPAYVDYASTPALVVGGDTPYTGWLDNACNLLGSDGRVAASLGRTATLDRPQSFYGTWDATGLHLAWEGADWATQGDLFLYFDTRPGGSSLAHSPYPDATSAIHLPILIGPPPPPAPPTPPQRAPMEADFLLWVEDAQTATWLAWNGTAWSAAAAPISYRLYPDRPTPLTDIIVPFTALGLSSPATQSVSLVALATEEESLDVWATMPAVNSLNSDLIVRPSARGELQTFILSRGYLWGGVGSNHCPSGVDNRGTRWPGKIQANGAHLEATLTSDPSAVGYNLFHHHLIFAHSTLFGGDADWGEMSNPLCQQLPPGAPPPPECVRDPDDGRPNAGQLTIRTMLARLFGVAHPPVGDGEMVHHTLEIVNSGSRRAHGVLAVVTVAHGMRLPAGTIVTAPTGNLMYEQTFSLGTMEAGERRTLTYEAIVDRTFNAERLDGWTRMRVVLFDETGGRDSASEDIHLDHELDISAPDSIELETPLALAGSGVQPFRGIVHDQSAVPLLIVEVAGTQTFCPDTSPADGQWECNVDVGSRADGTLLPVRLKARDIHEQESAWFPGPTLVVDASPPTLTLSAHTTQALTDSLMGPDETILSGGIRDNHFAERVEICTTTSAGETCTPAAVTLDPASMPTEVYEYDDQPNTPLPVGSAAACEGGTALVRTFTVPTAFSVADVDVGLTVEHPFRNDLLVTLTSPAGTTITLLTHSSTAENVDAWLTDAAATSIFLEEDQEAHTVGVPAFDAVRRPHDGQLASFRGQSAQGEWRLTLCDQYSDEDDGQYLRSRLALRAAGAPTGTEATWQYTLPMPSNSEADRALTLYGYDAAGNRSAPLPLAFTLDSHAPRLTVTHTLPVSGTTPLEPFLLAGQVADRSRVTLQLDIFSPSRQTVRVDLPTTAGAWSYDEMRFFPRAGIYCLWLRATDSAGNQGASGPLALWVGRANPPFTLYLPLVYRETQGALGPVESPPIGQAGKSGGSLTVIFIGDANACH